MGAYRVMHRDSDYKIISKASLYIYAFRQIVRDEEYFLEIFVNSMLKEWNIFKRHQKLIILREAEKGLETVKSERNQEILREVIEHVTKEN